jgi:hypothetical protein
MNKRFAFLAALTLAFASLCATGSAQTPSPVFSKDVAPILYEHCASCHRPGDIAPMPLLTYEQVRPWAKSIREKVALGQMPPWHATQPRGTFLNDRRLTDAEKDTLSRWAKDGAPQGDPKDLPRAPTFSEGWEIGAPDAVLSMAKSYDVPPSGTINYQYFTVPTNFTEDKWVQAIEVRPGTRSVVHHVLVFCREPGAQPRQNAFVQVTPPIKAEALRAHDPNDAQPGSRPSALTLVATTAPGTNAMTFRPGTAIRLKAGAVLVFQIHYTANGKAASDTTSVGMIFAKEPPRQEIRNSAFINPSFILPAGDANKAVDSAIQFNEDSHIWALFPHTHLRGKSWEYRLVYPDGRTETVLAVPKYDFNWQTYYLFATPLAVPKGARLEATAHYDNSAANAWNPDPKVDVRWGEQTWQEMQYTGITYTIDTASNERQ